MSELTPDLLADLESPHDLSISASGDRVVYGLRADWCKPRKRWQSSLWLAQVGVERSARQITSSDRDCLYWTCRFSPTDNTLIAVQSDRGRKPEGTFCAVDLMRVAASESGFPHAPADVIELTPPHVTQAVSRFAWSPDGRSVAYLSADEPSADTQARHARGQDEKVYGEHWSWNRLRVVDLDTRHVTVVVAGNFHVYDLAWRPDSQALAYVTTKTPELGSPIHHGTDIHLVSLSDRLPRPLAHFPNGLADLSWHADALWWRSNYDLSKAVGVGSSCVYRMPADGSGAWTVAGSGKDDSAAGWAVGPGMQGGHNALFVTVQQSLSDVIHTLPAWRPVYDSKEHDIRAWDAWTQRDTTVVAVVKSSATCPSELYAIVDGAETCLSDHGRAVRALGEIQSVRAYRVTAQDGTVVDGVFIAPSNTRHQKPASGWPTVVVPHGGPIAKVGLGFDACFEYLAPWLAWHGYAVLSPNYRGSSGRGQRFIADMLGAPGSKDYSDVIDMMQAAIGDGLVDARRVGIYGWSYGGCIAFVAVTRDATFHFAAAGALSGGTDWDIGVMTSDTPIYAIDLAGTAPWNVSPDDTSNRTGSPVWHMAHNRITTPVLILQGEDDDRVHITHARAFHHGCLAHGFHCEYVVYPREGHALLPPYERAHYIDRLGRLKRWFDTYLGLSEGKGESTS